MQATTPPHVFTRGRKYLRSGNHAW